MLVPRALIAFAMLLSAPIGRAQNAPSPVNPLMARALQAVCAHDLDPNRGNPARALQHLDLMRKKDPGNGFIAYLMAAAYAQKRDWAGAEREVAAGNRAAYHIQYVDRGPNRLYSGFARLRQLVRDCAAAAPSLGPDRGGQLLKETRVMAKRAAATEPRGLIPVLVGAALRGITDRALVQLYTGARRDKDAAIARRFEEVDRRWAEQLRNDARALVNKTDMEARARKHFTPKEWADLKAGRKVSPATLQKLAAITAEIDAVERPAADKALRSMPD